MSNADKKKKANSNEAANDETKKDNKGKRELTGKGYKIIISAVVLLFIIIIVVILLMRNKEENILDPDIPRGTIRGTVVSPDNVDEIREWLNTPPEDAYYTASMNVDWVFERWDIPSANAFVENVDDNTRTVYFDLFLDSNDELIYSSPYIPVGEKLANFSLDKMVPSGNHSATVIYHLVDEDGNELSHVSVAVRLIIQG